MGIAGLLSRGGIAALGVYMAAPVLVPIVYSFSQVWQGVLPEGFTFQWYAEVLSSDRYLSAIVMSFQVAFSAVFTTIALGVPAAYGIYRSKSRAGKLLRQVFQVFPMVAGPLILGISYVSAFNRAPLDFAGTLWLIVLGHAALGFPFMFRIVLAEFENLRLDTLVDAAMTCGAKSVATWLHVIGPNILGSVASGSMIVFAISFGEFEVAKMVGGFNLNTMPVLLFESLRREFHYAAVISAILIYVAFAGLLCVSLLRARMKGLRSSS